MDKKILGARIREQRNKRGLTLDTLSEMSNIGIPYLGEVERGIKMPSLKVFIQILNALDLSADVLLCDELKAGKPYVLNEITEGMMDLTPAQIKMVSDVFKAMRSNFKVIEHADIE